MKRILVCLLIIVFFLFSQGLILAQSGGGTGDTGTGDETGDEEGEIKVVKAPKISLLGTILKIINAAFTILILLSIIFLIIAGYYFVTAAGSPEQVVKARQMVLWAIVGVVMALLAKGIVTFICETLGTNVCSSIIK